MRIWRDRQKIRLSESVRTLRVIRGLVKEFLKMQKISRKAEDAAKSTLRVSLGYAKEYLRI
jgi:hypothetical protein